MMTEKKAYAAAKKRWGKNAAVRLDKGSPVGEERLAALARSKEARERNQALKASGQPVPPEFVKESREASSVCLHRRCVVGDIVLGMFLSVKGQGDTWEEAFEDADKNSR